MKIISLTTALADRYRIERELGAGGMAPVYLADDLKQRTVAINVVRPELAAALGPERFLLEIATGSGQTTTNQPVMVTNWLSRLPRGNNRQ